MALGVSIRGFKSCIRPVLATDGTHLKGKYRGTLLLATGLDGNNQIYPLAFGIVDSENDASWEWFLEKIHHIIGDLADLVIISDRHKSIEKSIKNVFPHAHHGICMYHLKQNVVAKFKDVDVSALLLCAAKTYSDVEFSRLMREIHGASKRVYDYLYEAGIERWARVHFSGRRYGIMTTNIAESLNAVLRDARGYPPVALLDTILMMLVTWFAERREVALKMQTTMTTWAERILRERDENGRRFDVKTLHHFTYYVFDGDKNAEVDLNEKSCTCKVFQLDQLPCGHALAAATKINISRYGLASKLYTTDALVAAYAEPIFPVGHEDFWKTSEGASNMVVLPPIMRVPSGRPRRNRILSQGEAPTKKKCGRCQRYGHNRKTCSNPIPVRIS